MDKKRCPSSRLPALDLEFSERPCNSATSTTGTITPDCRDQQLTTATSPLSSPQLLIQTPLTPCERFSRMKIADGEDGTNQNRRNETRASRSPTHEVDLRDINREGFPQHKIEQTPSSSHSSKTFSFVMVSSPCTDTAGDEVTPKVEEIGDNETLLMERIEELSKDSIKQTDSPVATPQNATNAPRKRGRPRKHPLPIPGPNKDCERKIKNWMCYVQKEEEEMRRNKAVVLKLPKECGPIRRNSIAAIPPDLPILIDGIETDVDRKFLDHFVFEFSRVLTLINDDSNPFKEILLPMATQNRCLMHSLMCLSGSHLSTRDPEPQFIRRKEYHFHRAITDLRLTVASQTGSVDDPELPLEDPMIASTLALCLKTICEGETKGEYRSHMDATRYFLNTNPPKNETFKQFIMEFFQYHDISNSLTTLDRRPICLSGDLRLPDFVPHAQAGALLGIFDGLFQYISEITVLRDRIRKRIMQGLQPPVDYRTLSEAVSVDASIRAWEPIYSPDNPNWSAAQLYRQSTWVYLYRTMRPSFPSEKISQVVDDGLRFLDQLPIDAGANSIMLMPLFLLGCSAFKLRQRERIRMGFDSLQAYSSLRNIKPAFAVVEKVWEIMDDKPEESWDWEKIIETMEMDFLIT
ncbi:C6 transcription factor [Paracoccidioides lutzii Pb01]|uniref:C6 transcription factor n=1 Tax=Paracoccidioides lutzii (strain ATCC MYA-826 / Pb01) TaxID=502779 RepID=C1HAW4_PARBA|nr:C6 transcription factor [Paracoccidioides lutzii Pb01]EEH37525.1 C6 transcription factor [Paracoccidioides lutzii Pb01]